MLECIVVIVNTVRILHPVIHEMVRLTTGRTPVVGLYLFVARKRKESDCEAGIFFSWCNTDKISECIARQTRSGWILEVIQ